MKKVIKNQGEKVVVAKKSVVNKNIASTYVASAYAESTYTTSIYDEAKIAGLTLIAKSRFTSMDNLQMAVGLTSKKCKNLTEKLIEQKLICKREIGIGPDLYALTSKGAKLMNVKWFNVLRVNLWAIAHSLIAQSETLLAMRQFVFLSYDFEPQENQKSTRPDAIWLFYNNISGFEIVVKLEVELTEKTKHDGKMDRFFAKIFAEATLVVFKDQAVLDRYIVAAQKYWLKGLPVWENCDGQWFKTGAVHKLNIREMENVYFKLTNEKIDLKHKLINLVKVGGMVFINDCTDHFGQETNECYRNVYRGEA